MSEAKQISTKVYLPLTPKQFWETPEEAQQSLKEWQDRLGMNDWHVHLKITTEVPKDSLAYCQPDFTHRFATIWVASSKSARHIDNCIKTDQEYLLVHELIHCIIPRYMNVDSETMMEAHYNSTMHQITERFARALYCAKYNLKPEWFFQ